MRGVYDVVATFPEALDHDEVIEIPEDDEREGEFAQILRLAPEAARDEAVFERRAEHAVRPAAVARYAAANTQFLERHPASVVGEDHRQTGCAALGRFHLEDDGRRAPAPAPRDIGPFPQVHAQGRSASLSEGTTRVMGARFSVFISTFTSVPKESVRLSPLGEVHAKPLAVDGSGSRMTRAA